MAAPAQASDSSMPSPKVIGERLGAPPPAPAWWHGAVFYEVFVRSFADSDGDGIGDLRGLTARLDLLNDGDPGQTLLGMMARTMEENLGRRSEHSFESLDTILRSDIKIAFM